MKCSPVLSFLLFTCGVSQPVFAHGTKIDYQQTSAIVVRATFDDGRPMVNAQAIVYSPKNSDTPWLKGVTDESGKFTFVPDPELSGDWDVKIRQSGHGKIVSIPFEVEKQIVVQSQASEQNQAVSNRPKALPVASKTSASKTSPVSNSDYSWQQKMIMSVSVAWGFLGTALFFFRKKT